MTIIDVNFKSVSKKFGNNVILNDLSFQLAQGDSLAILGPSGVGKSVLLRLLMGLESLDSGDISVLGMNLRKNKKQLHDNMAKNIGVLFQSSALFDSYSIWENIGFVSLVKGKSKISIKRKVADLLYEVGLNPNIMDQFPSSLSGGMKKRVALARAIAQNPKLLLCDEPSSGLDPIIGQHIGRLIHRVVKHNNASSITITHDINLAQQVASKIALLIDGTFVWRGTSKEMLTSTNPYIVQFRKGEVNGPIQLSEAISVNKI